MGVVNIAALSIGNVVADVTDVETDVDTLLANMSTALSNQTNILAATYGAVGGMRLARRRYSFAVDGGAQGALTMFTVTGVVMVQAFGVCQTDITGALATLELGIAGNTPGLIAQTLGTLIDQFELWKDATPLANLAALDLTGRTFVIANGADIIQTIGTAPVTAGIIDYFCLWAPLSTDGALVAA